MIINRAWCMPNKNTFSMKPLKEIINRYHSESIVSIDPFANNSSIATITNDIDTQYKTTFNLDAIDFLSMIPDSCIDLVFFDPPYSPRQISECYKNIGKSVNRETTQSSFWSNLKKEVSRVSKENAISISCGWNSGGIGMKYGFNIIEILLIAHGGAHNDTIVTIEKKNNTNHNTKVDLN